MSEAVTPKFCDERHTVLNEWCNKLETGVEVNRKAINGQKNWLIGVLVVVIVNLIVLVLK